MKQLSLVIVLAVLFFARAALAAGDDGAAAKQAIKARMAALSNLIVEYDRRDTNFPNKEVQQKFDGKALPSGIVLHIASGTVETHQEFSLLRDSWRIESTLSDKSRKLAADDGAVNDAYSCLIFTNERTERLTRSLHGDYLGQISEAGKYFAYANCEIDYILGLRANEGASWLNSKDIDAMQASVNADGTVQLTKTADEERHVWTFDPQHHYALTNYSIYDTADGESIPSLLVVTMVNEDFRMVDGVELPFKSHIEKRAIEQKQLVPRFTSDLTIRQYSLAPPENTADRYVMVWPAKCPLYDARAKSK